MKKLISLIGITLITATVAWGCSADNSAKSSIIEDDKENPTETGAEEDKKADYKGLHIILGEQHAHFTFRVADAKGFLEEEFGDDGITFERQNFENGPAQLDALASNALDFAICGNQPSISGSINLNVKIIAAYADSSKSTELIATPASGVKTVKDLVGKRIAISYGTSNHNLVLKILKTEGISEDDVELVSMSRDGDVFTAMEAGEIDAAPLNSNNITEALRRGYTKVASAADYTKLETLIIANTNTLEKYPEIASRLLKVLDKTNKWINENVDEAVQIVSEDSGIDKDAVLSYYNSLNLETVLSDSAIQGLQEVLDFMISNEIIKKDDVTIDDAIDLSYIKAAGLQ